MHPGSQKPQGRQGGGKGNMRIRKPTKKIRRTIKNRGGGRGNEFVKGEVFLKGVRGGYKEKASRFRGIG